MDDKNKFGHTPRTSFELATLRAIQTLKNGAELATLTGLFTFIAKAYESKPALWVANALTLALIFFIAVHVNSFFLGFAKPGSRRFVPTFIISASLGLGATLFVQKVLLFPVVAAIERQVAATPPLRPLPVAPAPVGNPAQPSADIGGPKPGAAPSAAASAAPAPSVPPSAAQSRSNTPEARKPD